MNLQLDLDIQKRVPAQKKSALKILRDSGRIPGIIYGGSLLPKVQTCVSISEKKLMMAFEKQRQDLIDKTFSYEQETFMIQDMHYNAFGKIIHIDFKRV
jgi:ribosomal protein L25 (general stress protein Ctc)